MATAHILKQALIIYSLKLKDLWYNDENAYDLMNKIIFILFYIVQQFKYCKKENKNE